MHVPDDIANGFLEVDGTARDGEVQPTLERLPDSGLRATNGKFVGQVCYCPTYDCKVYWSARDREDHFFQKGKSFPIDVPILQKLQNDWDGVEKLFIGVKEDKEVLEFDIEQYVDGEFINYVGPQKYAPEAAAKTVWSDAYAEVKPTS